MTNNVLVPGSWDILNVGHIRLLYSAHNYGDNVIVAVSCDLLIEQYKGIKPITPLNERVEIMNSVINVDKVIIQTKLIDPEDLKKYDIKAIVLGSDWKGKYLAGVHWAKEHNIKIAYLPYTEKTSSSMIKERIIKNAKAILKAQRKRK